MPRQKHKLPRRRIGRLLDRGGQEACNNNVLTYLTSRFADELEESESPNDVSYLEHSDRSAIEKPFPEIKEEFSPDSTFEQQESPTNCVKKLEPSQMPNSIESKKISPSLVRHIRQFLGVDPPDEQELDPDIETGHECSQCLNIKQKKTFPSSFVDKPETFPISSSDIDKENAVCLSNQDEGIKKEELTLPLDIKVEEKISNYNMTAPKQSPSVRESIILPKYKRAVTTPSHCVFGFCRNKARKLVPKQIKAMLLRNCHLYLPKCSCTCQKHLHCNSWDELLGVCNTVSDFSADEIEDMLHLADYM